MLSQRSSEFLEAFKSNVRPCTDERAYGRDPGNPYHDLLWFATKVLEPKLTVELGACTGGSTSYLAAASTGQVISIDIENRAETHQRLSVFDSIKLIHGDTRDPALAQQISKHGQIDLLFIDTDHTTEQVKAEMGGSNHLTMAEAVRHYTTQSCLFPGRRFERIVPRRTLL
ncbi:MAG TPA: CmcI family methyltransferase [Fimbriimonas sp.]|nr:CmcI family methyltransferase [Fimbriimonas sp.]